MPTEDMNQERMRALSSLNEEELYQRFWQLANEVVEPLFQFAWIHTTPSIERSVLMRMGFDSLQAHSFIERCISEGLLGKGAGALLLRYANEMKVDYFLAFKILMQQENWKRIFLEQ